MAGEDGLREIARDLLTLEINTVIKPHITARKMPPLPVAVLDIAGKYYWYLRSVNETPADPVVSAKLRDLAPEKRCNGMATFTALREASQELMNKAGFVPEDTALLDRVYRISSAIEPIIASVKARNGGKDVWGKTMAELVRNPADLRGLDIRPDEVTFVRKAWEIGVEKVVAQTIIHLDGDVITRLHPDIAAPEKGALREMHQASTRLSIETWKTVVDLVLNLISGTLKAISKVFRVG